MTYKLFIAIFAMLFTNNLVQGQKTAELLAFSSTPLQKDSLIIERQNGQKIRLIWRYRQNIKKHVAWEQLLDDFQSDFAKVVSDIPDFNFYRISYAQKQNLVIDEVTGKETYTVNENDEMDYVKSNLCKIHGKSIQLFIEFNDKKELLDPSLKAELKAAIAQIKNKFYISAVSPERHYYDVKSGSIIANPKPKFKLFVPFGARLGLLKEKPYIELRTGLGLLRDKRYYIALNWSFLTEFNTLTDKTEFDNYVGLTTSTIGAGFGSEVAFKVKGNISANDRIYAKAGVNYRTRSGILIGADYFLRRPRPGNENIEFLFGFNVGFGF